MGLSNSNPWINLAIIIQCAQSESKATKNQWSFQQWLKWWRRLTFNQALLTAANQQLTHQGRCWLFWSRCTCPITDLFRIAVFPRDVTFSRLWGISWNGRYSKKNGLCRNKPGHFQEIYGYNIDAGKDRWEWGSGVRVTCQGTVL